MGNANEHLRNCVGTFFCGNHKCASERRHRNTYGTCTSGEAVRRRRCEAAERSAAWRWPVMSLTEAADRIQLLIWRALLGSLTHCWHCGNAMTKGQDRHWA